ncbi:MAG: hypothetical protein HY075_03715 [Deltaproteobacteria bacterium]|nr:hypothetical protein [Deltaproteobacteria bacterium]
MSKSNKKNESKALKGSSRKQACCDRKSWAQILSELLGCCGRKISLIER